MITHKTNNNRSIKTMSLTLVMLLLIVPVLVTSNVSYNVSYTQIFNKSTKIVYSEWQAGQQTEYLYLQEKHSSIPMKEKDSLGIWYDEDTLDWGVDDVDAERIWGGEEDATSISTEPGTITGNGIKVAIIDSGIDTDHYDFVEYNGFAGTYKGGWDFVDGDNIPEDTLGHGTACSGIVAAAYNEWGTIGVAPKVDLYMLKVGGPTGLIEDYIIDAIYWAIDNGMQVISMSFGVGSIVSGHPELVTACLKAYQAGITLVAAAGNEGNSYLSCPASFKSVIGVGAVEQDQSNEDMYLRWIHSSYGWDLELVAPGGTDNIYTTYLNNDHALFGGTSSSAPHVAGVCALLLEAFPNLSPGEVRYILRESAKKDCFTVGYNPQFLGYGMVNIYNAIEYATNQYTPADSDGDGLLDAEEEVWGTNPLYSDSDGDGIPDGWEFNHFLDPTNIDDGAFDPDNDGLTNFEEFQNDTDPYDSDTDDDLIPDGWEVDNSLDPLVNDASLDPDNDGLTNFDEYIINTDPLDPDTDNDYLKDGWETTHSYQGVTFNPLNGSDGWTDHDNDGLYTGFEVKFIYTLWNDPDTDNDGWDDGVEVYCGSDPLDHSDTPLSDYDGDGLTNYEEAYGVYDFNGDGDYNDEGENHGYITDPFDSDTDGDYFSDYKEIVLMGTNPLVPNDPPGGPPGGGFVP